MRPGRYRLGVVVGLAVTGLAVAGCSPADDPAEPPACVGEEISGAQHVADMVPTELAGGGRAVASEIDMAADPPTADLGVVGEELDEPLRMDVTVGSTFEVGELSYEVVRLCAGGLDVVGGQTT